MSDYRSTFLTIVAAILAPALLVQWVAWVLVGVRIPWFMTATVISVVLIANLYSLRRAEGWRFAQADDELQEAQRASDRELQNQMDDLKHELRRLQDRAEIGDASGARNEHA